MCRLRRRRPGFRGWEAVPGPSLSGREGAAMRRNTLYAGAVLALAAMFAVKAGSALDLDLESVALLGGAMGAVIALVPDRTPLTRLAGFVAGFLIAWAGYVIR